MEILGKVIGLYFLQIEVKREILKTIKEVTKYIVIFREVV